jgi:uncharacterized protein (TIGR01244 family)
MGWFRFNLPATADQTHTWEIKMPDRLKINDEVTVGAQPSEAEIKALADDGFKTIINLRTNGEEMQPLEPDAEGELARGHGMQYVNLPVAMEDAGPELVDEFRRKLQQVPKPAYIHCKLGKRAGAMVMMDKGVREAKSGGRVLEEAEQMGFQCDQESLANFVKQYVDDRGSQG